MNLVVIGAQWGDEGKGKIVDYLAEDAEIVIRFSGGANAGHTIVHDDITYKLHLVPSGIVYPDITVVLGSGMVIDIESLFSELDTIKQQGVNWKGRIFISDRAHLVFPSYKKQDLEMEKTRRNPIGTTGRGIGVAYALKSHRDGIRLIDIFDNAVYKTFNNEEKEYIDKYKDKLFPMMINLADFIAKNKDKKKLFEGAQGSLLDLDLGTYPYVSSGSSSAAGACTGGAIGPKNIDRILGVFKAYNTRVGNGPFPTEFNSEIEGELENKVRETGREYGVTTGRPRRCGFLDLVALKYICDTNSITSLVLTHLDIYDEMENIKACVAYSLNGREIKVFPSSITALENVKPVFRNFKGWNTKLTDIKKYNDLPAEAKEYIRYIENYTGVSVDIVSVGYQRNETMTRKAIWTK
ncbi:MAG: adenylosuccinate synthase [Spirochaetia bacterium]|jgi:adenylosuccinate synthase|nr:adenylosuccinate synthase [Spirochaetia bacterium]